MGRLHIFWHILPTKRNRDHMIDGRTPTIRPFQLLVDPLPAELTAPSISFKNILSDIPFRSPFSQQKSVFARCQGQSNPFFPNPSFTTAIPTSSCKNLFSVVLVIFGGMDPATFQASMVSAIFGT
jgi:hypothetical protein